MNFTKIHTIIAALLLIVMVAVIACEKPAPQPSNDITKKEPASGTKKVEPTATPVSTTEAVAAVPVHTGEPITQNLDAVYRLYLDETKPTEFVEINQLKTVCTEEIGNLIGTGTITLNATLPDEKKIPLDRLVYIEFKFMGLTKPEIKGVGGMEQPIGFRDNTIVLKNPAETIEKVIVVLCRNLEGRLADGTPWTYKLEKDAASKFFKIERITK